MLVIKQRSLQIDHLCGTFYQTCKPYMIDAEQLHSNDQPRADARACAKLFCRGFATSSLRITAALPVCCAYASRRSRWLQYGDTVGGACSQPTWRRQGHPCSTQIAFCRQQRVKLWPQSIAQRVWSHLGKVTPRCSLCSRLQTCRGMSLTLWEVSPARHESP